MNFDSKEKSNILVVQAGKNRMPDRVSMDNIRTGSLMVLSRGDNPGRAKVTWVRCLVIPDAHVG